MPSLRLIPALALGPSLALAACGGGDAQPPDAGPAASGPTAVFAPPAPGAGANWGVMPYPSDLYLDGSGHLALTSLPIGSFADENAVAFLLESLAQLDGAGVSSHVFFPLSGDIDPATLAGNVVLLDLETGEPLETDLLYRPEIGAVQAAPVLGSVLREDHAYGAYLTSGVQTAAGGPVVPAAAFATAIDPAGAPSDPALAAARSSLQPLLDRLDAATRERLAVATVFRTQHVTAELVAMREIAIATPAQLLPDDFSVFADETSLDGLFGGHLDAPTPPGVSDHDKQPMWHGDIAFAMHGVVGLPGFRNEDPLAAGFIELDGDGAPIVKSTQPVKFTLMLPKGRASYADMPTVIWIHGINESRGDMTWLANEVARRDMALVAIDLLQHGSRFESAQDVLNNTTQRSQAGGDGFGDNVPTSPAARFFHLQPSGGVPGYHPRALIDNLRQSAIDLVSFAHFLGDITAPDLARINAALEGAGLPNDLSFRGDELGLLTESFGGMAALPAIALDDRIDVALLASPAASFPYPVLLHSANFWKLFSGIIIGPYGLEERVVLGDPVKGARSEPLVMLWNSVAERGDPVPFARYALDGTLRGDAGANLLVTETWQDEWVPNDATEHLIGVMGLPVMRVGRTATPPGPLFRAVTSLTEVAGPLEANSAGGARTAAASVWYPAAHAAPRKRWDYYDYEPEQPPFTERPERCNFLHPVDEVHAMWGSFFAAFFAGDEAPPVVDPFPPNPPQNQDFCTWLP